MSDSRPSGPRWFLDKPLPCHVGISWAAPYSTGHQGVVPAGEVIVLDPDPPPGATAIAATPERYDLLEPWLVGGEAKMRRYQGYHLIADRERLAQCGRPAIDGDAATRAYDAPEGYRSDGGTRVTGDGVVVPGRRFFHEGIEGVAIEERRGSRRAAGWLLLGGVILATAIVGIPMIVAAVVLFLYRRHEVMLDYAGERVALEKFAERAGAQALVDAILARRGP